MRKVSKEFDCETRGEEWWREAVKEQRETGQSETNKTLKLDRSKINDSVEQGENRDSL